MRLDEAALLRRVNELARIGTGPDGGVSRPGFSAADRAAIDYVAGEARRGGLDARVDPAGNLLLGREPFGTRPSLVMGSHLDTVHNGGRLDGAYGVLAALAVVEALIVDPRALEPVAVAFANEEGALYPQPFWGSTAFAGGAERLACDPVDREGRSLREPLRQVGGDLDAVAAAAWPDGTVAAYLELHIEQGPVLEQAGIPIGVVESIVGRHVFEVEVTGRAGHAGTTPMEYRRDALVGAAGLVTAVRDIAAEHRHCRVATTGALHVQPGDTNVVPGSVRLTTEVRDTSQDRLDAAERALRREAARLADATGCRFEVRRTMRVAPVSTDPGLADLIATAAKESGYATTTLPSGAGHDAQIVAGIAPIGMIFVPSRDGLSHTPAEDTAPDDLVAGARVLLACAKRLCSG
ncbi:M20 family metallo-hydrolase [Streptomyces sp. NPDC023838]|uniref:M20 family metallo-hydrolase n=1 Tax=Streptomyces sp. NPDC023838 TaxID=3154325 RepID=UPI0033E23EDA